MLFGDNVGEAGEVPSFKVIWGGLAFVVKAAGEVFFYPDFVSLMAIKMNAVLSLSNHGDMPAVHAGTLVSKPANDYSRAICRIF